MADPLSIASAIVGILSAAGQVIKILGPYVSAAKDTPMTASTVRSEVINFRILLSALQGLLNNLDAATGARTSLVAIDDLVLVLTDGVLIFSELEASVSSLDATGTGRPSLSLRIQWVRKEKELSAIVNRLQSFKGSVLLLLNILQCDSDLRASQTQSELSERVESLWANPVLSRRLANLEVAFSNLSVVRAQLSNGKSSIASLVSDDQSFYSIQTLRPTQSTTQTSDTTSPVPFISLPEFEADLEQSRVYQRTEGHSTGLSSRESVATSKADSVFSGFSLAQISVLSDIAVPVYSDDISNAQHYVFSEVKSSKAVKQKYLSTSSALYKSCSGNVIGSWSETRRRIFNWNLLQFEVQFEIPFIFVCPPTNRRGPVPAQPILFIDGSEASRRESRSDLPQWAASPYNAEPWRSVAFASNDQASWLVLLNILQRMEADSRSWQAEQYRRPPPPASAEDKKVMRWNTLPAGIRNPYAVTTMSHLVEIAAILGVYWIEFNRTNDNYRAVNSSLTLSGGGVPGSGIVFTIKQHKPLRFESHRVIPVDEVKELCFGFVPTIYPKYYHDRRLYPPNPEPRDLSRFNFASNIAIAETLALIGCNIKTVACFAEGSTARMLTGTDDTRELLNLPLMDTLHSALDDMDEILTASSMRPQPVLLPVSLEVFGSESVQDARQARVLDVLRIHIQEVFKRFNDMAANTNPSLEDVAERSSFTEIDTVAPELQQDRLMEAYFYVIRRQVNMDTRRKDRLLGTSGSEETRSQIDPNTQGPNTTVEDGQIALYLLDSDELSAEDIWCALVFRMICWLMLHDFHKDDVQIPKSELQGSRQPVYIV
ncbi:hypothetical protein CC79DRAFT_1371416 [Sarocladium strictum]